MGRFKEMIKIIKEHKKQKEEGPIVIEISDSKATQEIRKLRRQDTFDRIAEGGIGVALGFISAGMTIKGVLDYCSNNVRGGSLEVVIGAGAGVLSVYLIHMAVTANRNDNNKGGDNYTLS